MSERALEQHGYASGTPGYRCPCGTGARVCYRRTFLARRTSRAPIATILLGLGLMIVCAAPAPSGVATDRQRPGPDWRECSDLEAELESARRDAQALREAHARDLAALAALRAAPQRERGAASLRAPIERLLRDPIR